MSREIKRELAWLGVVVALFATAHLIDRYYPMDRNQPAQKIDCKDQK